MPDRIETLMKLLMKSPDEIYDLTYASVLRCRICNRAVADSFCEREEDIPVSGRMCRAVIDGGDASCTPDVRPSPPAAT